MSGFRALLHCNYVCISCNCQRVKNQIVNCRLVHVGVCVWTSKRRNPLRSFRKFSQSCANHNVQNFRFSQCSFRNTHNNDKHTTDSKNRFAIRTWICEMALNHLLQLSRFGLFDFDFPWKLKLFKESNKFLILPNLENFTIGMIEQNFKIIAHAIHYWIKRTVKICRKRVAPQSSKSK